MQNSGPEVEVTQQTISTETAEAGTEMTEGIQGAESLESGKTTVQIEIPGEISSDGEPRVVEFEVPEGMAEQVMEEAKVSLEEALAEPKAQEETLAEPKAQEEAVVVEEVSAEVAAEIVEEHVFDEEAEDDKVLTLDNNKYYY